MLETSIFTLCMVLSAKKTATVKRIRKITLKNKASKKNRTAMEGCSKLSLNTDFVTFQLFLTKNQRRKKLLNVDFCVFMLHVWPK